MSLTAIQVGAKVYGLSLIHISPWVAMLVVNTFDTTLWLSGNWQTAILFALLAANIVVSSQWPVARLATDH